MTETDLSPAKLKKERRASFVFIDEPIQWHLRNSKHDRCPWCGLSKIGYLDARKRICKSCGLSFSMSLSRKEWLNLKTERPELSSVTTCARHLQFRDIEGRGDPLILSEAQALSRNERAVTSFRDGSNGVFVYWHKDGALPENERGLRCVAAGSPYWRFLMERRDRGMWYPDEPMSEMEVIAKTAFEED